MAHSLRLEAAEVRMRAADHANAVQFDEADAVAAPEMAWTRHLCVLLCGCRDPGSPLSLLRGYESVIVQEIYSRLFELWGTTAVTRTPPAWSVAQYNRSPQSGWPEIAFSPCGQVAFPEPNGISVNMLPFVLGDMNSLPQELQPYYNLVRRCPVQDSEFGKVCYLTVSEGRVNAGNTQRRSGLHSEAPNCFNSKASFSAGSVQYHWGRGTARRPDELHGGLYMASSMDNTCAAWNALVDTREVDHHGGMEHLRPFLGHPYLLRSNELVWLTDRTPHEALPQEVAGYRQYFRLVTSDISLWFEQHSTPNPKVPLPDYVTVVRENKFAATGRSETSASSRSDSASNAATGRSEVGASSRSGLRRCGVIDDDDDDDDVDISKSPAVRSTNKLRIVAADEEE